ncbi:hypothetical protein [Methylomonas rivi]|uniref:DUF4536 domain-containing protein n=1 Tax=Methylomonas rivi TaxID=2952226 RepID=A0ABT1U4J9_9GAMM|nr:hypothetical protein [Methylomonas sp. WSC-6]MBS4049834.1 hypothetical protein [Methylomonas sp.]MCQ8128531.1 hypothetical protein [Methylomonas sp. WSC-6]
MKHYNEDCSLCKVMRSMAFSGVGMGIGAGAAYLLGASKENMVYSGIVVSAMLILGLTGRKK